MKMVVLIWQKTFDSTLKYKTGVLDFSLGEGTHIGTHVILFRLITKTCSKLRSKKALKNQRIYLRNIKVAELAATLKETKVEEVERKA